MEYDPGFDTEPNLDDVVASLNKAREEGKDICITFNGTRLYSSIDDEDSCYRKVTGESKAEYVARHEKAKKEGRAPDDFWVLTGGWYD